MNAIKRLGVLYGRLGLSTDADLIKRRSQGVIESANALENGGIPKLLRVAFKLNKAAESESFLNRFSDQDPTFDVHVNDKEASLLAAAILDYEIENETSVSPMAALAVATTALGGARRPETHDSLLSNAEQMLAQFQGDTRQTPADRKYNKQPGALNEAIKTIEGLNTNYYQTAAPHIITALRELGKYTEATALAAAQSDQNILDYVRKLESELRIYWWVSGAWSTDAAEPFRKLQTAEAAVRCGKELADKAYNEIGVFSAPALIDMVLERGRSTEKLSKITLKDAASVGIRAWRQSTFSEIATGPISDLLPVSTALGLSADSADAADWQPRFQRVAGISVDTELDPVALGLQVYRERLVASIFA